MRLIPAPLSAWLCLLAVPACTDVNIKSVRVAETVPATLQGAWSGNWTSSRQAGSGSLAIRLQEFAGSPVVSLAITNPCLAPGRYELTFGGASIGLRGEHGESFFAVLGADRTMTGTYECAEDAGTWRAAWQHELPTILDLSGDWVGTATSVHVPATPLQLRLTQSVRSGQLVVDGSLSMPEWLPGGLPVSGTVQFREQSFDMLLITAGHLPGQLTLVGVGDASTLAIAEGLLVVAAGLPLPFTQAVWRMQWTGP